MHKINPRGVVMEDRLIINKAYAEKYVKRKQAEELSKLKDKYQDYDGESSSSSSEEEDENADELTADVEREFLCTLSFLKGKDPRIYDQSTTFFKSSSQWFNNGQTWFTMVKHGSRWFAIEGSNKSATAGSGDTKTAPMYLKDYERQRLLQRGSLAEVSDSEDELSPPLPTYHEEQQELKESFKTAVSGVFNDEDELLTLREKTYEEKEREELEYAQWLRGTEAREVLRQEEKDMVALRNYWADPNLDDDEAFLRDYILNKGYLDKEDDNRIPTYQEVVDSEVEGEPDDSADEEALDLQEDFERKYNFRFEEPDGDLITSYPRTIEGSVRKPDDKRKIKRKERHERKEREKEERRQELKRLKNLKKKQIMEKLFKISDVTGNPVESLGITAEDLEKDFDPSDYDSKMASVFSESYYADQQEDEKPVFTDLDEEDELVDWDPCHQPHEGGGSTDEPHCEDPDFNMDADYDPTSQADGPSMDDSKFKLQKRRKKLSKFAAAVKHSKPTFDPKDHQSYDKYLEEYYKLTSDLSNTFQYRSVMPNDFGLSTDEVLMSSNKELNRWVSLSKSVQQLTEEEETKLKRKFRKRGRDWRKKKQILTNLYNHETETGANDETSKQHKHKQQKTDEVLPKAPTTSLDTNKQKKTSKQKHKQKYKQNKSKQLSASRLKSYGL